jgi:hypothetical protein
MNNHHFEQITGNCKRIFTICGFNQFDGILLFPAQTCSGSGIQAFQTGLIMIIRCAGGRFAESTMISGIRQESPGPGAPHS